MRNVPFSAPWLGLNNVIVGGRRHGFFYPNEAFHPKPLTLLKPDGNRLTWTIQDDWRPWDDRKKEAGETVLAETQRWELTDRGTHYWLDLDWTLTAAGSDVTFGGADYGGLFVRVENGGPARNSEGAVNTKADRAAVEGLRTVTRTPPAIHRPNSRRGGPARSPCRARSRRASR